MNETTERTFWEYLAYVSEHQSPLDFVLVWDHIDRFLWGTLLTLEITVLALFLGGLLSVPMAIARAYKHRWLNFPIWCFTYFFRGTPLLYKPTCCITALRSSMPFVKVSFGIRYYQAPGGVR